MLLSLSFPLINGTTKPQVDNPSLPVVSPVVSTVVFLSFVEGMWDKPTVIWEVYPDTLVSRALIG